MDTEYFSLNHSSNAKVIEDLSAVFPRVGISVLSDGLIIETVNCCDLSSFMVSSEKGNMSRILQL
jgi:hypothetical protein